MTPSTNFSSPSTTNPSKSAIVIGLCALGCTGDEGQAVCAKFEKVQCAGGRAAKCMTRAMVDHPESQAEIILAGISLLARTATSGRELRAMLPKVERVIEETCCA